MHSIRLKFSLIVLIIFTTNVEATAASHAKSNTVKKPNLIIILTDDQGYKDVGFNGSTDIKTPNIDRIAKEGTRFTNGYVSYPVCGPSRAGLLTGRYQDRFGFTSNPTMDPSIAQNGIPTTEKNIAEVLKPAGYTSGIIGKWHMGTHPDLRPNKRGFDYFYGFLSGGHQYFPEDLTLNDLDDVKYKYDWYRTRLLENEQRVDTSEYLTDELSHEAVNFIKRESDKPFFLYVAYNAPHTPLQASQKYLDRYQDIKDKKRRTYAAMVSAVDDGVGHILATLKEQGIDDNTLVVFLSDNGGARNNASDNGELRGHKNDLFEGGVRVPFAARWPNKIPAGVDYHQPVSSLDILATMVVQAKVDISKNKALDGTDLMPYITNEKSGSPHDILFWRHVKSNSHAVRSGTDKLVQVKKDTMVFDLDKDFGESKNVADQKIEKEDLMQKAYQQWESQLQDAAFPYLGSWKKNRAKTQGKNKSNKKNNTKTKIESKNKGTN
ncbi:sulfatase-like hydrolase/transferase [Colwellia sp. 12G3]|uniref:sulfatase-like hydrolase/transferase n=1 Tax=Colwellia sp. 12G3 TaxID=2058299 RepID=UPI000C32BBC0|nr:sulfatase-like hydrolase/transferase [Colwellia sp. 12G3]PKI16657.1 N-acetylgalactosamine 6-sulfate sulfatase [Colwellia sp. 12G3]